MILKQGGEKNECFRNNQHEIWLSVPIDYKNLEKGSTPLYAWTKKPFDQQKKTDPNELINPEEVSLIKVGKRNWKKLI